MRVPFLDLKSQYAPLEDNILKAVSEVLDSQICIGGRKVAELEEKIAAASDCKFAVGASSGTDAILNCLMRLDIAPDDEVITSPFTFFVPLVVSFVVEPDRFSSTLIRKHII